MRGFASIVALLFSIAGFAQETLPVLTPGKAAEGELQAGQDRKFRLSLEAGQFLALTAISPTADLAVELSGPDGRLLVSANRGDERETEDLPWVAATSGEYEVRLLVVSKTGGGYRLEAQVRAPTERDRGCASAYVLTWVETKDLRVRTGRDVSRKLREIYQAAIPGWEKCGEPLWLGYNYYQLASANAALEDKRSAREDYMKSIAAYRQAGETRLLSRTLNNAAALLSDLGEQRESIALLEESVAIRRAAHDLKGLGAPLNNIALAYQRLGEIDKAEGFYNQSLMARREVGDRLGEAVVLNNRALISKIRGDPQTALEGHAQALKIYLELGDKRGQTSSTLGLADIYFQLGDHQRAEEYWRRAGKLFQELGNKGGLATVTHKLGTLRRLAHDPEEALKQYQQALGLRREVGDPIPQANSLTEICGLQSERGQLDAARQAGEEALQIARRIGYRMGMGGSLRCLGWVEHRSGNNQLAVRELREALATYEQTASTDEQSGALEALAAVERDRGELTGALAYIERSWKLAELERAKVANADSRAMFSSLRSHRIGLYISILMALHAADPKAGYVARAFDLVEGWRARSLVEMMGESRTDLRKELSEEQRLREDQILQKTATLQRELLRADLTAPRKAELSAKLSGAESELDLFRIELHGSGSRYGFGQYADVLDEQKIRRELLPPGTALLEYSIGEHRGYAWALTRDGLRGVPLPGSRELQPLVDSYRKTLSERVPALAVGSAMARIDAGARKLYQMLIAPVESALDGSKRLVIVPDGMLAYLPFETLLGKGRMIERFEISYAPSASALAALQQRERQRSSPQRSLLAFGDPAYERPRSGTPLLASLVERGLDLTSLPNSREEVTAIGSLFSPTAKRIYLGREAREESLKGEHLENFRFLHFATHGYFDEEHPSRSGLVLAPGTDAKQDGVLQADEIMRLHLNADLVTLSACQTGLGKVLAGEGVIGLTRAFFYAGAQSLVVSLWNVNDAATAEMMKQFYTNLRNGMARDEALRQAKLGLMRANSAWRHPYYWAPFVFMGLPESKEH